MYILMVFIFLACTPDIQMRNESVVHLKAVTDIDFSTLASVDDMKVAAHNFDMVHRLEEILIQWYKQIEQVGKIKFYCYYSTAKFMWTESGFLLVLTVRELELNTKYM